MGQRIFFLTCLILIAIFFSPQNPLAQISDGLKFESRLESSYFSIYYHPDLDHTVLNNHLSLNASEKVLLKRPPAPSTDSVLGGLSQTFDLVFLKVCSILDMPLPYFHGQIKICSDRQELSQVYAYLFNKETDSSAFYVYNLQTIYVDAETVTKGILGHEMAHAIISNYFATIPPIKVQEILAMYVEYQLERTEIQR